MKNPFLRSAYVALLFVSLVSCSKKVDFYESKPDNTRTSALANHPVALAAQQILSEGFESGVKNSYAAGVVTLNSGSWNFDEALLGSLSSDRKNGTKAVRIRNTGKVAMNFDVTLAANAVVKFTYATYGNDADGTIALQVSKDGGSSYQSLESNITTSTTLTTKSVTIAEAGNYRFAVVKTDDNSGNRVNIDDFIIENNGTDPNPNPPGTGGQDNDHMLLGNISNATKDIVNANNYLMDERYFIVSYNNEQGKPNWVSWHVGSEDLGSFARSNNFRENPNLPDNYYRVQATSYSRSGFDRGHNCPSGDRTASEEANSATFLMTNMMPQAPRNNRSTWERLEAYTRELVRAGNEVYVYCGSYGVGGTGSNGYMSRLDNDRVVVPSKIWKVLVVIPEGNNDISRINAATQVIAINTPNENSLDTEWQNYRVSVTTIEQATGYSFFSSLPEAVRTALKNKVDFN